MRGRSRVSRIAVSVAASIAAFGLLSNTSALAYSGGGAAGYANYWATSRNSNYPSFGDDCTNFVSQALHDPSGGGRMGYVGGSSSTDDTQWWVHWGFWGFSWSHSWSVANDLDQFLINHYPGGWPVGTAHSLGDQEATYTPDSVVTGDVLFYDWNSDGHIDHAGIQVGWGTDPNSKWYGNYQDQHTSDRYHAFWSLIPYNSQWSTTTIHYMHIDPAN